MNEATKTAIVERLQEMVVELFPDMTFRTMYGGTVIELKKDDPKSCIGGIFSYSEYVSLELSKGVLIQDQNAVLEGKGKSRRHVKIHALEDLQKKGCSELLRQAVSLG